jgi:hypothetical protein
MGICEGARDGPVLPPRISLISFLEEEKEEKEKGIVRCN